MELRNGILERRSNMTITCNSACSKKGCQEINVNCEPVFYFWGKVVFTTCNVPTSICSWNKLSTCIEAT